MYRSKLPNKITQGCIVDNCYFDVVAEDYSAVILTPTCDIENDKADYITLIALIPLTEVINRLLDGSWKDIKYDENGVVRKFLNNKQQIQLEKRIKELMSNAYMRYHWFDPVKLGGDPLICDFQLLTSVSSDEINKLKCVGYLDSEWLEQLPARFVSYQGRIGTPNRPENSHEIHLQKVLMDHFTNNE